MSLYNANGQQVVTIVAGTSLTGLYSTSGTYNGVISSGGGWKGLYHPCGAYWVTVVSNPSSPVSFYAADGSLNIIQNSDSSYSSFFPQIAPGTTQLPSVLLGVARAGSNWTFTLSRTNTSSSQTDGYAVGGSSLNGSPAVASDFGGTFPTGTASFSSGNATTTVVVTATDDVEPN